MVEEEKLTNLSQEDLDYIDKFWKIMPGFYNPEVIRYAFPEVSDENFGADFHNIPNVRNMYKELVAPGLEKLRAEVVKAYENNLEPHKHPLEIFKPHLFERNKIDQYKTYLNKAEGLDLINDKLIIDQKISEYKNEIPLSIDSIYNNYWSKHTEKYVDYLDRLINQFVPEKEKICGGKKMVAVIAAMNETELEKVYSAIKNAYGEDFEKEVLVFFFHNFKDANAIPLEVQTSVNEVKWMGSNVLVIESEVPTYFFDAPAKKVAIDLILKLFRKTNNINVALIDADVFRYTDNIFNDAIEILSKESIIATSPEFDFDQDFNFNYPVLKLIFDIRRDLDYFAVREESDFNEQMTYGMCTLIKYDSLLKVGGLKPSTYVDGFLTNELRDYCGSVIKDSKRIYKNFTYPIYPISLKNHFVYVNSKREQDSLNLNKEAFSRWSGDDDHSNAVTQLRGSIAQSVSDMIPEFSDYTPANLCKALNKAWLFMFRFRPTDEVEITDKEIRHSKRLVRLLAEKGIFIKRALVQQKNESPYDLEKNEGDFFIRRIDEIIIKPKKI